MPKFVLVLQGLIELVSVVGFLSGFFLDIFWLIIAGGILMVIDDVIEIAMGVLNPIFPVILAIVLALIITPWYVGVFWASAAFKVLGVPRAFKKIFVPDEMLAQIQGIQEDPP